MRTTLLYLLLTLVLLGCTVQSREGSQEPSLASYTSSAAPSANSDLKHSVPLDHIIFDTFQSNNRAVPYTQADGALIRRLRDAIPPIHDPTYESAEDAKWLSQHDTVIGYAIGGQAWAYPVKILNYHEIVNDTLGGEPMLISYCPLCFSGIVYSREVDGRTLKFGNTSALYESDMVMFDYETDSYWWQVGGTAILGELTNSTLDVRPSQTVPWGVWREQYPDSLVLSRKTGFQRNYTRDVFANYDQTVDAERFSFPVSDDVLQSVAQTNLSAGSKVLVVALAEQTFAYPLTDTGDALSVWQAADSAEPVVIFSDDRRTAATSYVPQSADGRILTFAIADGKIIDEETGSVWDFAGRALSGPLAGEQLEPLPSKTSFWFAAIAAHPEVLVIVP